MVQLDDIVTLSNGARFYTCDLHTHTPVDKSFSTGGYPIDTEEQKKEFARELVRYVREKCNLEVLGVTEHNDVSWIPYIQEAAREEGLIVFPGVELGADGGRKSIHLLAIFNPDTDADSIRLRFSSWGLVPEQCFNEQGQPKLTKAGVTELTEKICTDNGLTGIVIAAHVFSDNGLLASDTIKGESRAVAYTNKYITAVEIPGGRNELDDWKRKAVNGELEEFKKKRVACLNSSDGRGMTSNGNRPTIGSKATYIKMSSPSVEALRQAFLDWESRVRLESEHSQYHYPRLIGIAIEGGFLKNKRDDSTSPFFLHLNPNLNCVIGGRGAGKSALIEALRYACDVNSKTTTNDKQRDELLRKTLPPGATVTVFYETVERTQYRIERTWAKEPRVFDAQSGEEKTGLRPSHLLGANANDPIDVYGQKEIYEITKDSAHQLRLLDTYVQDALRSIEDQKNDVRRQLETNAQSIVRMQKEIDQAQEKVDALPGINEQLQRMDQQQLATRLERKKHMEQEKSMLERASQAVEDLATAIEAFIDEHQYAISPDLMSELERNGMPHANILITQRAKLDTIVAAFQKHLRDLPAHIRMLWNEGEAERAIWKQAYDKEDDDYQQLLRDHPEASADTYMKLQAQRQNLELMQQEVEKRKIRIAELKNERREMLGTLDQLCRQEFDIRQQKAKDLNVLLGKKVTVRVDYAGNRQIYEDYLKEKLRGTNIRSTVIQNIANATLSNGEYTTPIDFVDAIRQERQLVQGQQSILETRYNIQESGKRILTNLPEETLFAIETFQVPDSPSIALQVNDKAKPLNELSVGQKCTAILSLILVERNTPLVIDQPEDDLDNRFIFDEIVQTLRREKERRQFIIATHNANIPVSGDAELIIVLDADEKQGWIDCSGSIDDATIRTPIENILEGGHEAFRIRQKKYGAGSWTD